MGPGGVAYGPTKPSTIVFAAGETGVFDLIFSELSGSDAAKPSDAPEPEVLIIDATSIKAHPRASSLNKGARPRLIGGTKGAWPARSMGSVTAKVVPCGSA